MQTVAKGEAFWNSVGLYRYFTIRGREEKKRMLSKPTGRREQPNLISPPNWLESVQVILASPESGTDT